VVDFLLLFGVPIGLYGLGVFLKHVWQAGLADTVGAVAIGGWTLAKWVGGIALAIAVLLWLGPLWSIVVLLLLILL
jgi:hypothetical protein